MKTELLAFLTALLVPASAEVTIDWVTVGDIGAGPKNWSIEDARFRG